MIRAWLVRRRETAGADYRRATHAARVLTGTPLSVHAEHYLTTTRRRLQRADLALDLWTLGGRR